MRIRLHIAFILVAFSALSCQKNEFESCTNYNRIEGIWESSDSDTKVTITFLKNGKVIHGNGLERDYKYKATSCAYEKKLDEEDYFFSFKHDNLYHSYDTNPTFDTIKRRIAGAFDISDDTMNVFRELIFTKIK
ncbi:MAG: hypothetical protein ACO1O6_10275 [Bacteroidota bacterium]